MRRMLLLRLPLFLHSAVLLACFPVRQVDVQLALWSDVHAVVGRVLLLHLVCLLLARATVLPCVGLWHRGLLVDHLSRYGYDVVFDELLADVRNVYNSSQHRFSHK